MTTPRNTDGNLAALNAYEREQDALAAADQAHEDAISELADELFDQIARQTSYFQCEEGKREP